jgi:hypothetical protein
MPSDFVAIMLSEHNHSFFIWDTILFFMTILLDAWLLNRLNDKQQDSMDGGKTSTQKVTDTHVPREVWTRNHAHLRTSGPQDLKYACIHLFHYFNAFFVSSVLSPGGIPFKFLLLKFRYRWRGAWMLSLNCFTKYFARGWIWRHYLSPS